MTKQEFNDRFDKAFKKKYQLCIDDLSKKAESGDLFPTNEGEKINPATMAAFILNESVKINAEIMRSVLEEFVSCSD